LVISRQNDHLYHLSQLKKKVNKVPCYCNNCNEKLVLNQIKLFHESASGSSMIRGGSSGSSTIRGGSAIEQLYPNFDELILDTGSHAEIESQDLRSKMIDDNSRALRIEMTDHYLKLSNLPRRCTKRYKSHPQVTDDLSDSENEQHTKSSLSENSDNER